MTVSNRLGITELAPTQNERSVTVNEAIAKLEAGAMFFPAIQVLLNTPPGSPVEGDLYIVGTAGTGAWSGHNEEVAVYYNASWLFMAPIEGMFAWDQTANSLRRYDGADWVAYTVGAGGIADADYGDITVSGSGTVWRVDALASPSAGVILYADNNSPGSWQQLAPGTSGQFLKTNGAAAPSWSNVPYDLPLSFSGTPTAGQLMGKLIVVRDVVLGANFTGSFGHVGTNPDATFDIDVKDNGSTIGTISVSTGGVYTFTTTSGTAKTVTAGNRIEFYAPANSPAEATVADIAATLKGTAV